MYKKYSLLTRLSKTFEVETSPNPYRINYLNSIPIRNKLVVYFCQREFRIKDNFSLNYAQYIASSLSSGLLVLLPNIEFEHKPKSDFLYKNIQEFTKHLNYANIDYEFISLSCLYKKLKSLDIGILITDFNPIFDIQLLAHLNCSVCEIDSHNIIPVRYISDKQEYSAATFRRKVYNCCAEFITQFDNKFQYRNEADIVLDDFIDTKLSDYALFRNDPTKNVLSGLSKYLNLGFISAQRVALSIINSNVDDYNKESFLEELIVRRELAENFCLYCSCFKSLDCVPAWSKNSLENHKFDFRMYNYSLVELENSSTHDILWNASQRQLVKEGTIHSYLRMYWAKKIMEWSPNVQIAIDNAIYLNDKYSFDAPSSSGYVGILWAIGGLHDRAFQDWGVTGKVRRMTFDSLKRKFDIEKYIDKYL